MKLWYPLGKHIDLATGKVLNERYFDPRLIIECCEGCTRIVNGRCTVYADPLAIWNISNIFCPMATHILKAKMEEKKRNPLKQSKKKARGKA